ncbi:uncharacterized protein LOC109537574 isoform X3 [Dendroctonus ponderosae]|uniref:Ionotropic glutamate receptor C-terminal domain-containing protein n=1 Tax=Dendroctonus ponderosae TaxID=77166 RepID=A0AAR5PFV0_DENPD|nr:uncharacterized protein LOC109537574 isoform X3 [Dendroctonus ponderosae]
MMRTKSHPVLMVATWNTARLLDSLVVSSQGIFTVALIKCGATVRAKKVGSCTSPDLQEFDFKQAFLGCPLKVLWVRYPPYMYEPNQTSGWKGIFVDFLEAVGHGLQRPIQLAPSDADYLDEVYQGYSYDSVLRDLQEADLFIGTADTRTAELFYLSPIIVSDYVTMLAPRALVDYWSHLRRALSLTLLILFGAMFFSMAAVLFGLSQLRDGASRVADIVMLLYGVSMGLSGHARLSDYSPLRLFLGLFLVVLMVLSFYLQATLTSVLSGPTYEPSISSIEELVESGLPLKLTELFKLVFEFGTGSYQKPHMSELAKRIEVLDEPLLLNVLDAMIRDRNFATLMINAFMFMRPNLEGTFGSFPVGNIDLCFAMGKNSYASPPLNAWIARALETGFFEKFKRLHHFELALKWNVEAAGRTFVVSWGQIAPALKVLGYGYGSAFLVLVLELLLAQLHSRLK